MKLGKKDLDWMETLLVGIYRLDQVPYVTENIRSWDGTSYVGNLEVIL